MNRDDAAQEIKRRYAEYLEPAKKRNTFICPLCGNGTGADGDGMAVDPHGDGTRLKCFKCGFYGDIVDLYQAENKCTTAEAFTALYDRFGLSPQIAADRGNSPQIAADRSERTDTNVYDRIRTVTNVPPPDFTEYFKKCRASIKDPAAVAYLSRRGISEKTAASYWIGYDAAERLLIIPVSRSFYVARDTTDAAKLRYKNPTGVSIELFNKSALYNEAGRPVFITEGTIDALSIIEAGGEAVALNGASNVRKLINELNEKRTWNTIIISLDNDEAGKAAALKLAEGLKELNIPYVTADICGVCKDQNEALTRDRKQFTASVNAAEHGIKKPDNTADYIRREMAGEIEALREQGNRRTGFNNLDAEAGSIYAGLYAVGGISSVGKTTFISQIADQMAAQGQHVIIWSMEQSRLEMVSKSISRLTAEENTKTAVSSLQIRTGVKGDNIARATEKYIQRVGDRVSIIEGNLNCTVSMIKEYARQYSERNGVKPVLVIDYLQVLQAEKDEETGRKMTDPRQIVDYNVTQLKRLSREGMPVFVISSVNRSNYLAPIDFEAFKESGGIEYTADVVWGLQLSAIHDAVFDNDKKIKEKRERIAKAKEEQPRKIELVCLKNRYGKSRYSVQFSYYPQFDYFEPLAEKWPPEDEIPTY